MKTLGMIVAVVCIVLFVGIAVTGFYVLWGKAAERKTHKNKEKKPSGTIPKPPPMKIKKGKYDDYCKWS